MASQVSITSNALLMLGAQAISAVDEDNDRARLAAGLFPEVRDQLLRSHFWNCAIKRVTLAADSDAPAFDYLYQFTLPSDWLRVCSCGQYGTEIDYRIEGRKLLCDDSTAYLTYVYRNEDCDTWDTMLVHAMTLSMAARMAYAVTQSASLEQVRFAELQQFMKQARACDGQDNPPETMGDFRLLAAWHGGYN